MALIGSKQTTLGDFRRRKTSDTLFIIGSGFGVTRIDCAQWQYISSCDSFGFNYSPLMSHKSTFYSCEFERKDTRGNSIFEVFLQERERENRMSIVKDVEVWAPLRAILFLRRCSATTAIKTKMSLEASITPSMSEFQGNPNDARDEFPKYYHSIFMITAIAILMKYKRIVFCGVDISDTRYFWQDAAICRTEFEHFRNHLMSQLEERSNLVEKTKCSSGGILSPLEYLPAMVETADVQGFVAYPESALIKAFPVFNWNNQLHGG
jgi:hypothetical protein